MQVARLSADNVELRRQLEFDARQFVALLQSLRLHMPENHQANKVYTYLCIQLYICVYIYTHTGTALQNAIRGAPSTCGCHTKELRTFRKAAWCSQETWKNRRHGDVEVQRLCIGFVELALLITVACSGRVKNEIPAKSPLRRPANRRNLVFRQMSSLRKRCHWVRHFRIRLQATAQANRDLCVEGPPARQAGKLQASAKCLPCHPRLDPASVARPNLLPGWTQVQQRAYRHRMMHLQPRSLPLAMLFRLHLLVHGAKRRNLRLRQRIRDFSKTCL